jgi:hypothetical protein
MVEEGYVHFVKVGNRALNLDSVTHCECQVWHDSTTVKVYFSGAANNTPIVLSEEEAKLLWKYIEYVAEKPDRRGPKRTQPAGPINTSQHLKRPF